MSGQKGIQNTLKSVEVSGKITSLILRHMRKGGFGWGDAARVLLSSEFRDDLATLASGITEVPAEVADLQPIEGFALAKALLDAGEKVMQDLAAAG